MNSQAVCRHLCADRDPEHWEPDKTMLVLAFSKRCALQFLWQEIHQDEACEEIGDFCTQESRSKYLRSYFLNKVKRVFSVDTLFKKTMAFMQFEDQWKYGE